MKAVSRHGSGVGSGLSTVTGLKKGMLKGRTNLPTPKPILATAHAMKMAVSGRMWKRKSIPSFPIILFHHLFM